MLLSPGRAGRIGRTQRERTPYIFTNPEARALVVRFSVEPTNARKVLIDTLIGSLKTAGVWAVCDVLKLNAADAAQAAQQNWKQDLYNSTFVNSPSFVADRGLTGDGATSYYDNNFNPITAASPNYTQDSASHFIWSRTNLNNGGASSNDAGALNSQIARQAAVSGQALGRANTSSGILIGAGAYPGFVGWSRTGPSAWKGYGNSGVINTGSDASAAPTNANMRGLSYNGSAFGVNQLAMQFIGGGLNDTQVAALQAAVQAYLQAIGAA